MKNKIAIEKRLWSKVDIGPVEKCWLWKGAIDGMGYGYIQYNGRMQGAHRVVYVLTYGITLDKSI